MTYTPESYNQRMREWTEGSPDADYNIFDHAPIRTAAELAGRRIGDAERIALTLLASATVWHIEIDAWIQKLLGSTACADILPVELSDAIREHTPGTLGEDDTPFLRARAENVVRLATQLALHRMFGEPDLEREENIGGFAVAQTSLAAAVADYNRHLNDTWASRVEEIRQRIRFARFTPSEPAGIDAIIAGLEDVLPGI